MNPNNRIEKLFREMEYRGESSIDPSVFSSQEITMNGFGGSLPAPLPPVPEKLPPGVFDASKIKKPSVSDTDLNSDGTFRLDR